MKRASSRHSLYVIAGRRSSSSCRWSCWCSSRSRTGWLPVPPFKGFSLRWYDKLFADRKLMEALGNSVAGRRLSFAGGDRAGFLAAYAWRAAGRARAGSMQFVLMAPITVSYLIIGLGLLIVFNALGIGKSLFAVGIGHVVINLPLCFAIIYSQMGEHQANIERAAHDLGASDLQALSAGHRADAVAGAAGRLLHRLHAVLGRVRHRLPAEQVRRDPAGGDLEHAALRPQSEDQCGRHVGVRDLGRPGRSGRAAAVRGGGAMAEPIVRLRGISKSYDDIGGRRADSTWTSQPASSSCCWGRPAAARRPSCR